MSRVRIRLWFVEAVMVVALIILVPPSFAASNNKSDTKAFLQSAYMEYLREEGYRPTLDTNGNIKFKKEGLIYYIFVNEKDPKYFSMLLPGIYAAKNPGDEEKFRRAANMTNLATKVAKATVSSKGKVSVSIQVYLSNPQDIRGFFGRAMVAINVARKKIAKVLQGT